MSKNLTVKSTMLPHHNIHKCTWTSPDGKTYNQLSHIVAIDGHYNKILVTNATGCNPQK
jgi:hypothetical protein